MCPPIWPPAFHGGLRLPTTGFANTPAYAVRPASVFFGQPQPRLFAKGFGLFGHPTPPPTPARPAWSTIRHQRDHRPRQWRTKESSPTRVTSATANCQYPTTTYPRINGPAHANVCFFQRRHACSGPPPGSPLSIWGHEPAKPYAPTTTTADSGDGQLTAATGAMPQLHRRHLLFRRRLRFKCTSPTTLAALLPGNTPVHSGSTSNAQKV